MDSKKEEFETVICIFLFYRFVPSENLSVSRSVSLFSLRKCFSFCKKMTQTAPLNCTQLSLLYGIIGVDFISKVIENRFNFLSKSIKFFFFDISVNRFDRFSRRKEDENLLLNKLFRHDSQFENKSTVVEFVPSFRFLTCLYNLKVFKCGCRLHEIGYGAVHDGWFMNQAEWFCRLS